jgi:hypothetical protein
MSESIRFGHDAPNTDHPATPAIRTTRVRGSLFGCLELFSRIIQIVLTNDSRYKVLSSRASVRLRMRPGSEPTPIRYAGELTTCAFNRGESRMTPDLVGTGDGPRGGRNPRREPSPNAPGALANAPRKLPATAVRPSGGAHALGVTTEYDEVDRRLMDTFPASDAVGRY